MTETTFVCSNPKCKALDHDRSPAGVTPPRALNCWKCKAGFGKELQDMMSRGIGMYPTAAVASA